MKKNPLGYILWPKAFALLQRKSPTTIEEVAMWIWSYPPNPPKEESEEESNPNKKQMFINPAAIELSKRGIRAYTNIVCESHESQGDNAKYRFSFDEYQLTESVGIDGQLCGLWFSELEIREFEPIDRYLTYNQVATRWDKYEIPNLTSFLRAQVHAERLLDLHPAFGATQLSNPDAKHLPASVEAIFPEKDIHSIESQHLKGTALNNKPGTVFITELCVNQAKEVRLKNPDKKLSQRAIAEEIYKLDYKKKDSDKTKIGLQKESIRKHLRKMGKF